VTSRTHRPISSWTRLSPWLGLCAGSIAFVGIAGPAHAATPAMTHEALTLAQGFALELLGAGAACLEGLHGLGGALGLDPSLAGGGAPGCPRLHGLGFTFLGLMAVVVIALGRMRLQTEQRRLEVVRRLVEQGLTPPRPLLEGPARKDRRKGVVLVFAGTGLVAAGFVLGDRGLAAAGLIPAFIGLGYLVSYRLAIGHEEDDGS
jgi:hypothetical protein